jgi:hypothetical protein
LEEVGVSRFAWAVCLSVGVLLLAAPGRAQDAGLEAEGDGEPERDDFLDEAREPRILTYIPFDGSHDAYHPYFHDEDRAQLFGDPFPKLYVPGKVGQARDFLDTAIDLRESIHQGAPSAYPVAGALDVREGTLTLWFCWSKNWRERLKYWTGEADSGSKGLPPVSLVELVGPGRMESWFYGKCRGDGQWHHLGLAWSRRSDTVTAFLDGSEVGRAKLSDISATESAAPGVLKADPEQALSLQLVLGRHFPGAIDEVVVWDKALPPAEVRKAFERSSAGKSSWPENVLPTLKSPERPDWVAQRAPSGRPALPQGTDWRLRAERPEDSPGLLRHSLKGIWRVQPTGPVPWAPTKLVTDKELLKKRSLSARYEVLDSPWLYRQVPGPWRQPRSPDTPDEEKFLETAVYKYPNAWLERDFDVPEAWRSHRVTFDYDALGNGFSRQNRLYLNGQPLGRARAFARGQADLTPHLRFGASNRLLILLAEGDLGGEVWLSVHESLDVVLKHVYVSPDVETGKLRVRFEVLNHTGQPQDVSVTARLRRWHYNDNVREQGPFALKLTPEAIEAHNLELSGEGLTPWNPEDTTLYQVTLTARGMDGKLLDSTAPVRFGYRTIRVDPERSQILLNGHPLHFRGTSHNALQGGRLGPSFGAWFRRIGANAFRTLGPDSNFVNLDPSLAACDEVGLLCHYNCQTPYWGRVGHPNPFWRNYLRQRRDYLQNHPSFAIWQPWMTGFFPAPWGHPMLIGAVPGRDFDPQRPDYAVHKQSMKVVGEIDPEHPMYFYRAGIGGQVRAHMHYQGPGVTLQGKEEWPRYWFENRDKIREPFSAAEVDLFVFMWDTLWQIGLQTFQPHSESCYDPFGYGAWFLGEKAYAAATARRIAALEVTQHLKELGGASGRSGGPAGAEPGDDLATDAEVRQEPTDELPVDGQAKPAERSEPSAAEFDVTSAEVRQALLQANMNEMICRGIAPVYRAEWYGRVIRAWRTYGIGFMVHCDFSSDYLMADGRFNEAGLAVVKNNAPVLVYLAHDAEDFVRKDHAFFAGEEIRKEVVVCNDRFKPVEVECSWKLAGAADPGRVYGSGECEARPQPGEIVFLPLKVKAPDVTAKERLILTVSASVDGEREIRPPERIHPYQEPLGKDEPTGLRYGDELAIQVFPREQTLTLKVTPLLVDSVGDTTRMLKSAGVPFKPLSPGEEPPKSGLLIIGRQCLAGETATWFASPRMAESVRAGLNVIVFEQRQRWLAGLRMKHLDERSAYLVDPSHPLAADLADEDFANWRAASDIIAPYPVPASIAAHRGEKADSSPPPPDEPDEKDPLLARGAGGTDDLGDEHVSSHWSNNGMVATYAFLKPQKAGYRPILQNGFDLLYTPLLEQRVGNGTILYCSLDVTNRYAADPVATLLVNRMLAEYGVLRPAKPSRLLAGGERSSAMAAKLGFASQPFPGVDGLTPADILFVRGEDSETLKRLNASREGVRKALEAGTAMLLVKAGAETPLDFLPFAVDRKEAEVLENALPKDWPLLRGLSVSDFFWRRTTLIVQVSTAAEGSRSLPSGLVAEVPVGQGRVIFLQADENVFDKPYDRLEKTMPSSEILRRWVRTKICRATAILLSNMGAAPENAERLPGNAYSDRKAVYVERGEPFHPMAHRGW